ncbi:MAG TPA: DUF1127 domain-containing protein [Xanthobacteraceae bacterium]|jgi:uncharacterized protein YjiS (DUF1127 family)
MTRNLKRGSISAFATAVIEAVVAYGRRGTRHLHAWWRYDTSVRELWKLTDRELADLGINRKDIARVAWEYARDSAYGSGDCVNDCSHGR